MIEQTNGNLLEADVEALVNTVNTEGVMGKGIALQFKEKFPEMFVAYKKACEAGQVHPGRMDVHDLSGMFHPRYIINFPTKRHWRSPSRIEDIESGLAALKAEILKRGIKSVALPPLGCGNGGLDWADVLPKIEASLGSLAGVRVMIFPPKGAPTAEKIVHHTARPKMNPTRAILLKSWKEYAVLGYELTLLEVHKILYFIQEAGEALKLNYAKGQYGPYARNLRHVLNRFESHFTLGFGDGQDNPEKPISLLPGAVQEAEDFLATHAESSEQSLKRLNRVEALVEGFESPYGLELLATVHWVIMHERANHKDERELVNAVHKWNERKKRLMSPDHIMVALNRLSEETWWLTRK